MIKKLIALLFILIGNAVAQNIGHDGTEFGPKGPIPADQGGNQTGITQSVVNGVYNAAACGTVTPVPAWCSGSDIGAWINAAVGALPNHCGEIYVPAATYKFSTTITIPRCVKLYGAGAVQSTLNYIGQAQAIIVSDSTNLSAFTPRGALEDLSLAGPGSASQAVGVYLSGTDGITGGTGKVTVSGDTNVSWSSGAQFNTWWAQWQPIALSLGRGKVYRIASVTSATALTLQDAAPNGNQTYWVGGSPSSSDNPSDNYGDNFDFNRVRISAFIHCIQWGNNAWLQSITQSSLYNCGAALYLSAKTTQSGENIAVKDTILAANSFGLVTAKGGQGDVDWHISGSSFDNNTQIGIANGNSNSDVTLEGSHFDVPNGQEWIANLGVLNITNSYFTSNLPRGTFGIDNQSAQGCSITNTFAGNGGRGSNIINPGGQPCSLFNLLWTGPGLGLPASYESHQAYYANRNLLGTTITGVGGVIPQTQGYTLQWNLTNGQGETDFVNNHGGGTGGWNFYDCGSSCSSPTLEFKIDNSGNVHASNGTNIVYRCVTAGATLPVGSLTINSSACGSTADTGLRVK